MIKAFLINSVLKSIALIELPVDAREGFEVAIQERLESKQLTYFAYSEWDRVYYDKDAEDNGGNLCFKLPKHELPVFGEAIVVGMYLNMDVPMAEGPVIDLLKLSGQLRFFSRNQSGALVRKPGKQHELKFNPPAIAPSDSE